MTIYEMEVLTSLKAIAHELKKANKLKAIELKGHLNPRLDSNMVDEIDEIMENES